MHNGCDIANQQFSNGQLWTWPLIFEICWTRRLSLVVYIWSYLWFSFQVCSTQAVYSFTKWTAWGLAPNEDNRTPGTGRLKRLEHCELMNTYRSWWRHKTSGASDFTYEDNRTPGTGRLKRLEHCELMNTYRSWWRHKTSGASDFTYEDNRTPGTGRLKRLEHCELMNTYRSWWRHKTSGASDFT